MAGSVNDPIFPGEFVINPTEPSSSSLLPKIFNTGIDVLDSIGNAIGQFKLFDLQKKLVNAQIEQSRLLSTVETPNNVNARTRNVALTSPTPPAAPSSQGLMVVAIAAAAALALLVAIR